MMTVRESHKQVKGQLLLFMAMRYTAKHCDDEALSQHSMDLISDFLAQSM